MKLCFINACLTHVRFSTAIHGLRHFWEADPARLRVSCSSMPVIPGQAFKLFKSAEKTDAAEMFLRLFFPFEPAHSQKGRCVVMLPQTVEGQGRPETSAQGCARSVFWKAFPNLADRRVVAV